MLLNVLILFLAATLHEDVAILMACFFALERDTALVYGLSAVYLGAVLNNYAIYGLGVAARRLPGVRRWLIGDRVEQVRQRLKKHLVSTIVVCRFIPGSLSPSILGCGWLGVPFARFAWIIAVTAAGYVALVAAVVYTLGDALFHTLSKEAGPVLLALAILVAVVAAARLWKRPSQKTDAIPRS